MVIIITVDKYNVIDVTAYENFRKAEYYAKRFNETNPNAKSIEILSKVNGAILRKVK